MKIEKLQLSGVSVRRGESEVLRGIDAVFSAGDVSLIVGPNGSGKSTLLRTLAALLRPCQGKILVNGTVDINSVYDEYRKDVGFYTDMPSAYLDLTVKENILFLSALYMLDRVALNSIESGLKSFGVVDFMDRRPLSLSNGQRRKISIALSILHNPQVILLDEPETGLDDSSLEVFKAMLNSWMNEGKLVLLATHRPYIYKDITTSIFRINNGKLAL